MGRVSLSRDEKSIVDIWNWYDDQKTALREFRNTILDAINTPNPTIGQKFLTFTRDEVQSYFDDSFNELEHLVAFDLISAIEGNLRADFYLRIHTKDKSNLGREFRNKYKAQGDKISLENDIIEGWKNNEEKSKNEFSELLGLLHYRHWLAHGRYWTLNKKGRRYSADETFIIAEKIIALLTD